jgi:coatomer subunit beta'
MDNSGKIIWARHNEIQTVNVKSLGAEYEMVDGERLPLAVKDLGACDLYPQVRPPRAEAAGAVSQQRAAHDAQ